MIAMEEGKPFTTQTKTCLKETDTVEKYTAQDPRHPNCSKKVISQTSNSVEIDVVCTGEQASHAHVRMKTTSPTTMVATTDADSDNGVKMHAETKSHWVNASCEEEGAQK
jgi:hypothetical protein